MSYIAEIRAAVGNRPLVLAGVSVLVVDASRAGQILLQRRSDNGCWSNPGGMIEPGESAEETALREVAEETGYEIEKPELVTVVSGSQSYYIYPNGDQVYNVTILYIACIGQSSRTRAPDSETIDLEWFPFDNLPNNLSPPTSHILDIAKLIPEIRKRIHQI